MIHETRDGKKIPIALMDDEHLINTIKLFFAKYSIERNSLHDYVVGKKSTVMTPEIFDQIIENYCFYFMEAMRRDSTRLRLITILGTFSPVYKTTETIVFDENQLLLQEENYDPF